MSKYKKEETINILILGNSQVGKSSLIQQYCDKKIINEQISIKLDFKTTIYKDQNYGQKRVVLWDTVGMSRYSLGVHHFKKSDGAIILYDLTNQQSFKDLNLWVQQVQKHCKEETPIIIAANKGDLQQNRCISQLEAQIFAKNKNLIHHEISVKNNIGLNSCMRDIIEQSIQQKQIFKLQELKIQYFQQKSILSRRHTQLIQECQKQLYQQQKQNISEKNLIEKIRQTFEEIEIQELSTSMKLDRYSHRKSEQNSMLPQIKKRKNICKC